MLHENIGAPSMRKHMHLYINKRFNAMKETDCMPILNFSRSCCPKQWRTSMSRWNCGKLIGKPIDNSSDVDSDANTVGFLICVRGGNWEIILPIPLKEFLKIGYNTEHFTLSAIYSPLI